VSVAIDGGKGGIHKILVTIIHEKDKDPFVLNLKMGIST
jgi:hypothetical protein